MEEKKFPRTFRGKSVAAKTLEPCPSFWGQVGHLLMMWCYQSGSGNSFLLDLQIKSGLARVKNDCSCHQRAAIWHPPPLKSFQPEHRRRGGRRTSPARDAKSSAQIHMCLTGRMKHFLRVALAGPEGACQWLWSLRLRANKRCAAGNLCAWQLSTRRDFD